MDYWAELDSQMCYKKDAGKLEAVEKATREYADVIAGCGSEDAGASQEDTENVRVSGNPKRQTYIK